MIIDTILKIDTASFQTGIGRSVQMVQSFIQIGQGDSRQVQGRPERPQSRRLTLVVASPMCPR